MSLSRRCPICKVKRKFEDERWDTNHGGEDHPRRPAWQNVDGRWICGWCYYRTNPEAAGSDPQFEQFMHKALSQQVDRETPSDFWKSYNPRKRRNSR